MADLDDKSTNTGFHSLRHYDTAQGDECMDEIRNIPSLNVIYSKVQLQSSTTDY